MRRQTSKEFIRRQLVEKYTEESVDEWLKFHDDPQIAGFYYDGTGQIIGYINERSERIENEQVGQEILEKLRSTPRLTSKLLYEISDRIEKEAEDEKRN